MYTDHTFQGSEDAPPLGFRFPDSPIPGFPDPRITRSPDSPLSPQSVHSEFKAFALKGNLVDLAVGFTVGAAFTTIARSFVDDLVMPLLGLVLGGTDFSQLYVLLRAGEAAAPPYATLAAAQEAGAVTLNYGLFINAILTFLLVAMAMFVVVRAMNRLSGPAPEPEATTRECPFCKEQAALEATRCPHCTSVLEPTVVVA